VELKLNNAFSPLNPVSEVTLVLKTEGILLVQLAIVEYSEAYPSFVANEIVNNEIGE
jgi:hypothetical protein